MKNVKPKVKENLEVLFPLLGQTFHFDLALVVNNKIISIGYADKNNMVTLEMFRWGFRHDIIKSYFEFCYGLSRISINSTRDEIPENIEIFVVDVFIQKNDGKVYLNTTNTVNPFAEELRGKNELIEKTIQRLSTGYYQKLIFN